LGHLRVHARLASLRRPPVQVCNHSWLPISQRYELGPHPAGLKQLAGLLAVSGGRQRFRRGSSFVLSR
jgi:hypothetical protein